MRRFAFEIYPTGDVWENQGIELPHVKFRFTNVFLELLNEYGINEEDVSQYLYENIPYYSTKNILKMNVTRSGYGIYDCECLVNFNIELPFKGFRKVLNDIVLYSNSDIKVNVDDVDDLIIKKRVSELREQFGSKEKIISWFKIQKELGYITAGDFDKYISIVQNVQYSDFLINSFKDFYFDGNCKTMTGSIESVLYVWEDELPDDYFDFIKKLNEEEKSFIYNALNGY